MANQINYGRGQGVSSLSAQAENVPEALRLHAVNNAICMATERAHSLAESLNRKADAIVGSFNAGADASTAPTPVPNGALDQIDMALRALSSALDRIVDAERRFEGLA